MKLDRFRSRWNTVVRWLLRILFIVSCVLGGKTPTLGQSPDWYRWRGPEQNGISREVGLISQFDPRGGPDSNVLWKNSEAGGISTPIVMRGKLYTIVRDQPGTSRDAEKVVCLDAETGDMLWEHRYNVFLSDVPAERVGWSNCAGDPQTGFVYVLGSSSLLQCLDGSDGKVLWSRSLSEEFGMLSTYGGRTNTPVLFEDLVIASGVTTGWDETARPTHRFLAFDKSDGRLVWVTGTKPLPEDTTYSTPFITELAGKSAIVAGSGDGGLYAIQPRTGEVIWSYPLSRRGVNVSPIVAGGVVFAGHSEENPVGTKMGAVAAILGAASNESKVAEAAWKIESLTVGRSSPLLVDDRLYVVDDAAGLHVIDAQSGNSIGKRLKLGTAMRGSLVWADGKIFACSSTGIFHILKPTEKGVEVAFRTRMPAGEECGGSMAVWHGKLYLPTTGGLYCLATGNTSARPQESTTSTQVDPSPASKASEITDLTPAMLQIVPPELLVEPGQSVRLEVRAFNAAGQRLPQDRTSPQFTVRGAGSIDDDGTFHVDAKADHSQAWVSAAANGLTAESRIRVVPPLPWKFGFTDGQVPVTWIGARYRHVAESVDGEPVIVKISTIPKGTRSQLWMGPTHLHDYTVQADLQAVVSESGSRPDMGVIAQRYTLDLMGESQQLQIRTWPSQLRMAKTIPFPWQAGVWYTVKLQASNEQGRAVLRGKVWQRGESEPNDWTITAADESPNVTGSPGLFGNATNAEVLIDNVQVMVN